MRPVFRFRSTCVPRMRAGLACAFLFAASGPALLAQGRVEGQVRNGTLGRTVPNQEVRLLMPRGGMQQIATVKTNATGRFSLVTSEIDPSAFYLLETRFQEVPYHAPVRFDSSGTATVDLTVFDSTRSEPALRIQSLRILIRAEGTRARVEELYDVLNPSQPPRAYTSSDGTFQFRVAVPGAEPQVAVIGLMNMPVPQTAEPGKSSGEFAIRYPLKPGLTQVAVSYDTDYSSPPLDLSEKVPYPVERAEIYVSPSSLSVESPVFKPAGIDRANNVQKFEAGSLPRGASLEARIAGEAPASSQSEIGQAEPEVKVVPNSMTRVGLPLLACFLLVLFWALGVRVAKEWPRRQLQRSADPAQKQFAAKVESLLNSLADLDELFASGKVPEAKYWKERLELKARLAAALKKSSPSFLKSYATRHSAP